MSKVNLDKFNFFIPMAFEKATDGTGQVLTKIKGVCSSVAEDSDGETLMPEGFDFNPLLKSGFLNWNHQGNKTSKAICGEPTTAKVINGGKDFYIEGFLYPNDEGKNVAELAQTLEKHSPTRRLGFSIEGQAVERDMLNPKKITKARITGVAITQCPKNPNTLMSIVKGEYSDPYILDEESEDDEKEKAMDVAAISPISKESVEGVRSSEELINVGKKLKKSDIYVSIINRYTTNIEKAKQIYNFVSAVNKKLYKMTETITEEVLQKSFDILDGIVKAQNIDEEKVPSDYDKKDEVLNKEEMKKADDEDDDVEKASNCQNMAKSLLASGMSKDDVVKAMTGVGVSLTLAETACQACITQASNLPENGGDIEKQSGFQKSEEDNISKSIESVSSFLQTMSSESIERFSAIGTILKSIVDERKELKDQINTLQKGLSEAKEEIETVNNQPNQRKSIQTSRVIEKFEKSERVDENDTYNINTTRGVAALTNRLFEEVQILKSSGKQDDLLEKAVMDLEISKSTNYQLLQPRLRAMRINIVQQ